VSRGLVADVGRLGETAALRLAGNGFVGDVGLRDQLALPVDDALGAGPLIHVIPVVVVWPFYEVVVFRDPGGRDDDSRRGSRLELRHDLGVQETVCFLESGELADLVQKKIDFKHFAFSFLGWRTFWSAKN